MASIRIAGLHKRYGEVTVIKNIDVDVADGEFVVLVGPSGCGKSTLLRMIAGLEPITSGEIHIGERVVNHLPAKDRDIAMVFQNYALYPHMTVADNMAFSMKMRGENKNEIARRLAHAAAILGLEPLMQRTPRQLSGGQRQRVAMGRAIVRDPKVFLFDEPLSNLDAQLRVQMRTEIRALHRRLSTTMVYVTHDQIEAMTMADKIVVMRDGVVEQIGAPMDLYDRPANLFVAGFIGSPAMNVLPGRIAFEGAAPMFLTDANQAFPLPAVPRDWHGRAVRYGVRPEHLLLRTGGVAAQVLTVEPTGPETHVVATAGPHKLVCVVRERTPLRAGDAVGIVPDATHVHLFDSASGQRLQPLPA